MRAPDRRAQSEILAPGLHTATLPTPALSLDDVLVLVDDAITLFGRHAAKHQASLVVSGAPRAKWHPWAPGFAWFFAVDLRVTPIDVPPVALVPARDMHLLKALPEIYEDAALRARAADLIRTQREAALEEFRAAGFYRAAGMAAEWTAVTGSDTADVLLRDINVEFQMKTRLAFDGMSNEAAILHLVEKARGQIKDGRAGVVAIAVPGVTAWDPWALKSSLSPFFNRLSGHFSDPRYERVAGVVMIGDPKVERRPYGVHLWVPGWLIRNDRAAPPLPPDFRMWTTG